MNDAELIKKLGGTFVVAKMFSIRPPSVSEWKRKGIPKARRMYLEVVRPDLFKKNAQAFSKTSKQYLTAA